MIIDERPMVLTTDIGSWTGIDSRLEETFRMVPEKAFCVLSVMTVGEILRLYYIHDFLEEIVRNVMTFI